jgi:hypothetical protein
MEIKCVDNCGRRIDVLNSIEKGEIYIRISDSDKLVIGIYLGKRETNKLKKAIDKTWERNRSR